MRVSALLKACESFKEKLLFCFRISAAEKNKSANSLASVFPVCVSRLLRRVTAAARLRSELLLAVRS
jgi:hypothetical protein